MKDEISPKTFKALSSCWIQNHIGYIYIFPIWFCMRPDDSFLAEIGRWWLIKENFVYRHDLYFVFTSKQSIIHIYVIPCRGVHCKTQCIMLTLEILIPSHGVFRTRLYSTECFGTYCWYIHLVLCLWLIVACASRSQCPRGLRRRSAASCLLKLWVQIPPAAWMFVCCECCVLSGRGLCDELITHPEEYYRLCCVVVSDLETSWMRRPWPTGGLMGQIKEKQLVQSAVCRLNHCTALSCAPVKKELQNRDSQLQRVTIPEAAYKQLWRRPPEDEQGNARNM
jgi:hypothetical protein